MQEPKLIINTLPLGGNKKVYGGKKVEVQSTSKTDLLQLSPDLM